MMLASPRVISLAPRASTWLRDTKAARVLNDFDRASNLVNEHQEVMSLVSEGVGNGPFHAVLAESNVFRPRLQPGQEVLVGGDYLLAGRVRIALRGARSWSPIPDWARLHASRAQVRASILSLQVSDRSSGKGGILIPGIHGVQAAESAASMCRMLVDADLRQCSALTARLAGLGPGSTPSGDDFLLGVIYAAWIVHPRDTASAIAQAIARRAIPLTTSLSGAWLAAASHGEAGAAWHDLLGSAAGADARLVRTAAARILRTGATSGEAALAGLRGVFDASTIA